MISFLLTLVRFLRAVLSALKNEEFRALTFFVALTIAAGALFYHNVEGWNWLDSFYFSVITLTTVGYGDFSPQTGIGKVFTIVYIFIGLGLLLGFINVIGEEALKNRPLRGRMRGRNHTPDELN